MFTCSFRTIFCEKNIVPKFAKNFCSIQRIRKSIALSKRASMASEISVCQGLQSSFCARSKLILNISCKQSSDNCCVINSALNGMLMSQLS